MSSPEREQKIQEVADFVNKALGSREKSQIKFAAARAFDAYNSTGELIFFTMYAECQYFINHEKGYRIFREYIAEHQLQPNPHDSQNAEFFTVFASHLLRNKDFEPDKNIKREAFEIVKPFIKYWNKAPRKEFLLLILLENHQFDQVEELALSWLNEEKYYSIFFLMHINLIKDNLIEAFNSFCDLALMLKPDGVSEINNPDELSILMERMHHRFGIYSVHPTDINKYRQAKLQSANINVAVSDTGVLFNNAVKLSQFICDMLDEAQSDIPEEEMSINELADSWQHHYFGFRNVPERDGETGLSDGVKISIDPDSGNLVSDAIN